MEEPQDKPQDEPQISPADASDVFEKLFAQAMQLLVENIRQIEMDTRGASSSESDTLLSTPMGMMSISIGDDEGVDEAIAASNREMAKINRAASRLLKIYDRAGINGLASLIARVEKSLDAKEPAPFFLRHHERDILLQRAHMGRHPGMSMMGVPMRAMALDDDDDDDDDDTTRKKSGLSAQNEELILRGVRVAGYGLTGIFTLFAAVDAISSRHAVKELEDVKAEVAKFETRPASPMPQGDLYKMMDMYEEVRELKKRVRWYGNMRENWGMAALISALVTYGLTRTVTLKDESKENDMPPVDAEPASDASKLAPPGSDALVKEEGPQRPLRYSVPLVAIKDMLLAIDEVVEEACRRGDIDRDDIRRSR